MQSQKSDAWLTHVAGRLCGDGFEPLPPPSYAPSGFTFAARRSRFELTKFGMSETFFVFAGIPALDPNAMRGFSSAAFQFAIRSKAVPLPCGFFESVWTFPVAITSNLDPRMADWLRNTEPPKHWSAGEIPVAFDAATGALSFYERTPAWGAAYYAGFRKQIRAYLG